MSIRIGANPIGWTNDDLQEIGGDTPLETCLAEAREAGIVGMEKGHKMPSDGAALKDKLAEFQGNRIWKLFDVGGFVLAGDGRIDSTPPSDEGGGRRWLVLRPVLRI